VPVLFGSGAQFTTGGFLLEKVFDHNSFTFHFASRLPPLFPIFLEGEISSSVLFGIFLQASVIEKSAQKYVMYSVKYFPRNYILAPRCPPCERKTPGFLKEKTGLYRYFPCHDQKFDFCFFMNWALYKGFHND
jgi:hypothetical protein